MNTGKIWFYYGMIGAIMGVVVMSMAMLDNKDEKKDKETERKNKMKYMLPWLIYAIIGIIAGIYTYSIKS